MKHRHNLKLLITRACAFCIALFLFTSQLQGQTHTNKTHPDNTLISSRLAQATTTTSESDSDKANSESKPVEFKNPSRTIEIGAHIENIYSLSLRDKSYWMEGWYWLKWPEAIQNIINVNKIPVENITEFTNAIETGNLVVQTDSAEPINLPDGRKYQLFRYSGKFYVDYLDLRKVPFHTVTLPLTIELRQDELSCYEGGPECVYLKPEANNEKTLIGEFAAINGYHIKETEIKPSIHQYRTNFGIGKPSAFGQVSFNTIYSSDFWTAFNQYLLPLLVIIGIVLASPSLPAELWDVRLAIPTTALLTLIFLQQAYRADFPPLSYLTFIDWIYSYAYLLSIAFFALFSWAAYVVFNASESAKVAETVRVDKVDNIFQIVGIIGLILTLIVFWNLS